MSKIIMLGTGSGFNFELFNTCFVIQNENGNFLVDTGGSVEIVRRLKQKNINLNDIKNIFISHQHTDHILGLIWMFKKIGVMIMHKEINDNINIYCSDVVYTAIKEISKQVLPELLNDLLDTKINYHILTDRKIININGYEYKFFDIMARGNKQFGFKTKINNKTLTFLGDETLNLKINDIVKGSDYVMHEALCLDSEESIFHAYDKHHSTVKNACEIMNDLNVKNLILYHTEESHGKDRKFLYEKEGKEYFKGNVIVPDDMEEIEII